METTANTNDPATDPTKWHPRPEALAAWETHELVAFFMSASQPSWLSEDESTVEA